MRMHRNYFLRKCIQFTCYKLTKGAPHHAERRTQQQTISVDSELMSDRFTVDGSSSQASHLEKRCLNERSENGICRCSDGVRIGCKSNLQRVSECGVVFRTQQIERGFTSIRRTVLQSAFEGAWDGCERVYGPARLDLGGQFRGWAGLGGI